MTDLGRLVPTRSQIFRAATLLALVAVVTPFVVHAAPQVVGADHSFVVLSGSMEPEIKTGDVIVVREAQPEDIEVGDVITFVTEEETDTPTTHKVIEVVEGEDGPRYRTKGVANEDPDPGSVSPGQVIGEVWFVIPYVGYVVRFAGTQVGFVALVVAPITLLVVTELASLVRDGGGDDSPAPVTGAAAPTDTDASVEGVDDDVEADPDDPDRVVAAASDRPSRAVEAWSESLFDESDEDAADTITLTPTDLKLTGSVLFLAAAYATWVATRATNGWSIGALVAFLAGLGFVGTVFWAAGGVDGGSDGGSDDDDGDDGVDPASVPTVEVPRSVRTAPRTVVGSLDALARLADTVDSTVVRARHSREFLLPDGDVLYAHAPDGVSTGPGTTEAPTVSTVGPAGASDARPGPSERLSQVGTATGRAATNGETSNAVGDGDRGTDDGVSGPATVAGTVGPPGGDDDGRSAGEPLLPSMFDDGVGLALPPADGAVDTTGESASSEDSAAVGGIDVPPVFEEVVGLDRRVDHAAVTDVTGGGADSEAAALPEHTGNEGSPPGDRTEDGGDPFDDVSVHDAFEVTVGLTGPSTSEAAEGEAPTTDPAPVDAGRTGVEQSTSDDAGTDGSGEADGNLLNPFPDGEAADGGSDAHPSTGDGGTTTQPSGESDGQAGGESPVGTDEATGTGPSGGRSTERGTPGSSGSESGPSSLRHRGLTAQAGGSDVSDGDDPAGDGPTDEAGDGTMTGTDRPAGSSDPSAAGDGESGSSPSAERSDEGAGTGKKSESGDASGTHSWSDRPRPFEWAGVDPAVGPVDPSTDGTDAEPPVTPTRDAPVDPPAGSGEASASTGSDDVPAGGEGEPPPTNPASGPDGESDGSDDSGVADD